MAKSNKWIKFEIETSTGTKVDLSKHWKSATLQNADGTTERMTNEEYLKVLDEKYSDILAKIVKGR